MMVNASITAWEKRTGHDGYGQSVFTAQTGGPWPILAEPKTTRLKINGRKVISSLRVHIRTNPGIAQADKITVDSMEYTVLEISPTTHRTLGHVTLLLG